VLATVLATVLGAGGLTAYALRGDPAPAPAAAPTPSPTPRADPGPLLPALREDAPEPTAAGLSALLQAALRDPALGGAIAASVVDAATGEPLLEQRASVAVVPASTAKIATAVAALTALEPTARLSTVARAGAAPGEVVLVGGGDVLLASPSAPAAYPQPARLADLAREVRAALAGAPVTRVLVDDTAYVGPRLGPGWKPTYVSAGDVAPVSALSLDGGRARPGTSPRVADPALVAGRALAALLGAPSAVARGTAPQGAPLLGAVESPPVPQLVEAMLIRSDNDLAESLARQVALSQGQPASFAGAAAAVATVLDGVLADMGTAPGAVRLSDGSGLSRLNRLQPGALTRLLAAVASGDHPRLTPVLSGLPVAGFDGTLGRRYRTGPSVPAAGVVRAKTGTLNGVSALAGLLRTADGRLLAFDVTADAVPLGATRAAERALDRLAAGIAGCGCRA
jgi:D-alanyl-D-alanine carboxypeptidase/D-alanyl-D-alanine-endopeptidase (penicillin-binding protein 4)